MARKLHAIMFALFLGLLGCARFNPPEGDEAPPTRHPVLRVATSGDYQPFSVWDDAEDSPRGFSVDVAEAFARSEGSKIEWVRFVWADLLGDLAAKRFDLALSGITVRPERSVAGLFSVPLTTSGAVVLVPVAREISSATDLDQRGVRLAVNAGGHLERVARKFFPDAHVDAVARNEAVLDRLWTDVERKETHSGMEGSAGVDGVVTDSLEAPHWQARASEPLRRIGPLTADRKAALFPSAQRELARRFDAWLIEAEGSGLLDTLRARHGLPPERTASPLAALLASLDERLALMVDVARSKAVLGIPIEDREVEARVITAAWARVEGEAAALDRSPPGRSQVEALFRAQIEAAKWIQSQEPKAGSSAAAGEIDVAESQRRARSELDRKLRPALIRIGDRIAALLARLEPENANDPDSSFEFEQTSEALMRHDLPDVSLRALHEALLKLLQDASRTASTRPHRSAERDITTIE